LASTRLNTKKEGHKNTPKQCVAPERAYAKSSSILFSIRVSYFFFLSVSPLIFTSMPDPIHTSFDSEANAFIVRFPEHTTLADLMAWGDSFRTILKKRAHHNSSGLLLDTNRHDFESIECLKYIRDLILEFTRMDHGIHKVAFVQPVSYRQPEIVSSKEGYFLTVEAAWKWLGS